MQERPTHPPRPPRAICAFAAVLASCACASPQNSTVPAASGSPIAIVPVNTSDTVTGASQITAGTAMIASSGSVTSGPRTTPVVLPRRGVLRVCAFTTVKLASDSTVPADETPGLMIALDKGAIEASFAIGTNSDVLLTPDFRILVSAPGSADLKVRLGDHGDTCVDNAGKDAPYVLVSSVFDGGAYRVQPGQRVMFQHGSLREVVDQEKEPCGCPPESREGSNDFPVAQSAGLVPLAPAAPPAPGPDTPVADQHVEAPLVYHAPSPSTDQPSPAEPLHPVKVTQTQPGSAAAPSSPKADSKPGFFRRVGRFFRKIFGGS